MRIVPVLVFLSTMAAIPAHALVLPEERARDAALVDFRYDGNDADRALYIAADKDVKEAIDQGVVKAADIGTVRRDLNGDGVDEMMVYVQSSYYCGSLGCRFRIFAVDGGALKPLSDELVVQPAISYAGTKHNGYEDLIYDIGNGKPVTWAFDSSEGEYRAVDKKWGEEPRDPALEAKGNPTHHAKPGQDAVEQGKADAQEPPSGDRRMPVPSPDTPASDTDEKF